MKKTFYTLALLVAFVFAQSCNKSMDSTTKQVTIDTALASGAVYQLNLSAYGKTGDVATIVKQATNPTTSKLTATSGTFAPVYTYAATTKVAITDEVVLAVANATNSRNCGNKSDSTLITIKFSVQ